MCSSGMANFNRIKALPGVKAPGFFVSSDQERNAPENPLPRIVPLIQLLFFLLCKSLIYNKLYIIHKRNSCRGRGKAKMEAVWLVFGFNEIESQ